MALPVAPPGPGAPRHQAHLALQTGSGCVIAVPRGFCDLLANTEPIMKQIAKNEIFKNLSGFLKSRGVELTDGAYTEGIRQSCSLLTNAINLGQQSLEKARQEFDKTREHIRQVVHEKTAPKPPPGPAPAAAKASARAGKADARKKPAQGKPRRKKSGS